MSDIESGEVVSESVVSEPVEAFESEGVDEPLPGESEEQGEAVEAPVKYKVKVDGEEIEVDQETLLRDYQLSKASHKKFQEAARAREEAESTLAQVRELAAQAKNDPSVLFKALGLDARQYAETLLIRELEESLLSDEEKELRDHRAFRKKLEDENKLKEKSQQEARQSALVQQAGEQIEEEIVSALQSSGLKPTPRTVARVAEMLLASMDEQGSRMKATDALQRLHGEYRSDVVELLEGQDPEVIEKEYPSLYKKILSHAQKKVSAPVPTLQRGVGSKQTSTKPKAKSIDDWLND